MHRWYWEPEIAIVMPDCNNRFLSRHVSEHVDLPLAIVFKTACIQRGVVTSRPITKIIR